MDKNCVLILIFCAVISLSFGASEGKCDDNYPYPMEYFGYHQTGGYVSKKPEKSDNLSSHVNIINLWLEKENDTIKGVYHKPINCEDNPTYPDCIENPDKEYRFTWDYLTSEGELLEDRLLEVELCEIKRNNLKIVLDIERLVFSNENGIPRLLNQGIINTNLAELASILDADTCDGDYRDIIFALYPIDEPYWKAKYNFSQAHLVPADYNNQGSADVSIKTHKGKWLIDYAENGFGTWDVVLPNNGNEIDYGNENAIPVPADYDGDGEIDLSVKTAAGKWKIDYAIVDGLGNDWDEIRSGYGGAYAIPVPGDYDGDGASDLSVKTTNGEWMIDYAEDGFGSWDVVLPYYGNENAIPVPADYDGDGSCDLSVKTNEGLWHIDYAVDGFGTWDVILPYYGGAHAIPVPADYDGDNSCDLSVKANSSQWMIDYAVDGFGTWDESLLSIVQENMLQDLIRLNSHIENIDILRDYPLFTTFAYPTLTPDGSHYLNDEKYYEVFDYLSFDYYKSYETINVIIDGETLPVSVPGLYNELKEIVHRINDAITRDIFLTPPVSPTYLAEHLNDPEVLINIINKYVELGESEEEIVGMIAFQYQSIYNNHASIYDKYVDVGMEIISSLQE